MKRVLASLLAAGVSVGFLWYGSILMLFSGRFPTVQLIAALLMLYGLVSGFILAMAWLKPKPQYAQWSVRLAAAPLAILLLTTLQAEASGLGIYTFQGAMAGGLLLAAQVGCIRFLSAAQQGAPADGPASRARG